MTCLFGYDCCVLHGHPTVLYSTYIGWLECTSFRLVYVLHVPRPVCAPCGATGRLCTSCSATGMYFLYNDRCALHVARSARVARACGAGRCPCRPSPTGAGCRGAPAAAPSASPSTCCRSSSCPFPRSSPPSGPSRPSWRWLAAPRRFWRRTRRRCGVSGAPACPAGHASSTSPPSPRCYRSGSPHTQGTLVEAASLLAEPGLM